jgi:outer membrane receptor protein involved in Fe transport
MSKNSLCAAIRRALQVSSMAGAALGVASVATTAQAQQATTQSNQQPQTLQTIVVTGSHIRRVDLETSNPVIAVSAAQIQATGKLTLGDVIQQLPGIIGGVENPRVNNGGGSGATQVGLRGLGASRTLVLVDGERVIDGPGGPVDLNTIPTAAVERIEVLTDGASAVYGSDAIGGVINIILKSNYQGAQFQVNYGISDRGDGARRGASFMFGQTSDKGSILAGVDYNKFDPVMQATRSYAENAVSLTATNTYGGTGTAPAGLTYLAVPGSGITSFIGGSHYAARDWIYGLADNHGCPSGLSLNPDVAQAGTSPTTLADYHCFDSQPGDRYNYASVNLLMTPQERTNLFFKGVYHLSDNIDFYATVYHNKTRSAFQLAPTVLGSGVLNTGFVISKDSYYNPFGVDFSGSGATIGLRMFPAGPRYTAVQSTTDQLMAGFKGSLALFGQDWQWDAGYNFGHGSIITTSNGLPNQNILNQGAGPSFLNADGVVQCGTAADGSASDAAGAIPLSDCTPFDPFNLFNPNTQAVIQGAATPALTDRWVINRGYHADISGGLFDLPAGTVQLAAGASYRKLYTNNVVSNDLLVNLDNGGQCILGSQCTAHLQGGYNVKEAYAEVFIPLLKDLPLVHALNVTLGDRYSRYSSFGSTNNWKIGIEYRPIEDLLLRGTVSSVFRAPTITDVFRSPISSAPLLTSDPCDHITVANPACANVPLDGSFVDFFVAGGQQLSALRSGSKFANFPLGPESGKSFDFGAVYSPHFVPGLSASVDIWRIYLGNVITSVGAQTVLDQCFNGVTIYCPLIQRSAAAGSAGQIQQLLLPTVNLGRMDVKGIDLAASYRLPQFSFGQFNAGVNATYMQQYKIQTAPGQAANRVLNAVGVMGSFGSALGSACPFGSSVGMCFFPRVKAIGTLGWQLGPWDAQWTMTYTSEFKVGSLDPSQGGTAVAGPFPTTGPAGPYVLHFGAWVYNNVQVGYDIEPIDTRIDVGVDNVFDKQPPMLFANNVLNANTDPGDFDTLGRYYWARLTVRF